MVLNGLEVIQLLVRMVGGGGLILTLIAQNLYEKVSKLLNDDEDDLF